ncbi:unnamed protein product, partial [Closterium sp. NIES-54]
FPTCAGESAPSGTASAQVFHTFTLDSGASRSFFRDRTTLTPLSRPVAVSLADPSGGPVLASFSTVLPCPAAPSGSLSGLYLPSFSTNLVSGADLQDQGVDQFTPASQRVTHCTCARTGRHLATFTRRPGSSLYTLSTESSPVSASGQVAASSQALLWHHRLGHPSLPRLRGMASRVLVSGLPRSLPPLPPGPAPTCVPCVEGRQRAAPHSSEFPPTEAPLQTIHMDVWGPARVHGQGHERYFLLVVDDYSRYTTVFPLRSKGEVTEVLIDWIRAARLQLRESFGSDFPVLRLHSDRGGEFSSALLGAFCRAQGIRQTFTLPASPQQNGIAERRKGHGHGRRSYVHDPCGCPPFSVAVCGPGSRAFVRELSADKLSPRAVPCVFLGFPPDAPGWQFYHPTSRRVLTSQDITFDESVPYYRLFPYRTASLPPPPLFLAPGPPPVDPLPPQGPAPLGVSQVEAVEPVEVAVDSGAATDAEPAGAGSGGAGSGGAETEGAEPGGAKTGGAEPGGAATGGTEPGGAEPGVTEPGDAEPGGAGSTRVASRGASSRREVLSPQELREWFARRWGRAAGAGGTTATTCHRKQISGAGAAGPGGPAEAAGVGPTGGSAGASGGTGSTSSAGPGAAGATGVGAAGGVGAGGSADAGTSEGAGAGAAGAGGATGAGAPAGSSGAVPLGSGGTPRPRPYFVPLLEQVLGLPPSPGPAPSFACPQPVQSQSLVVLVVAVVGDVEVEPSGPYPELVGCLMYLMTCTRPDLAYPLSILARYVAPGRHRPEHMAAAKRVLRYLCSTSGMGLVLGGRRPVVLTGHADASWADDQATQRSSQGYTFSLGCGSVSWRSTRSSSVLSSSCEAEIYAGAMAAQELRWLTYLLTDLGEQPRSPPVMYVDNKAMLALCREHRLEHRTKHIALRYFLARELQQRGQLRLAYVASEANTADIFTKALAPGDHQRFCTLLGLVPTWPHLLTS